MDFQFNRDRPEQIAGGTFLIGLALLFMTGWWWPGIMFVLGATSLARTYAQGKQWSDDRGALVLLLIGVVFGFFSWNWLPLVLIGIGAYLLFGDKLGIGTRTGTRSAQAHRLDATTRIEPRSDGRSDLEREIDEALGRNGDKPERKAKNDELL
jgi:hypothetical protein